MERRKKILIFVSIFLVVAVLAVHIAVVLLKPPSADKLFQRNINSIVELKCVSEGVGESFGTAEIISEDGKLVTNAHVIFYKKLGAVTQFEKYFARFASEEEYREIELIKHDVDLDLAVLKFIENPDSIKAIKLGNSDKLKHGDRIYAIGNSQNYGLSISEGIIGIPKISIEYDNKKREVIQCDLTITEGNSGGALLSEQGELIGITTFRTKDNNGNVIFGVAYCIPINIIIIFAT